MSHYIGIDVSCKTSVICAIDEAGNEVLLKTVDTSVEAIARCVNRNQLSIKVIGLETGTECHHLARGLRDLGYPVDIIDARKSARIIESLTINKNDPNDARALAQLLRANMHHQVQAKSTEQLDRLALLKARRHAVNLKTGLGNQIRGLAKVHGVKCPGPFRVERWQQALENHPNVSNDLRRILEVQMNLYIACANSVDDYDEMLVELEKSDVKVKQLMTSVGVGRILAITYLAHIDGLKFSRSRNVGPILV